MSQESVPQGVLQDLPRASRTLTVESSTRVSCALVFLQSVPEEFPARVSFNIVVQERLTRESSNAVPKDPSRMSYENLLKQCPIVLQESL